MCNDISPTWEGVNFEKENFARLVQSETTKRFYESEKYREKESEREKGEGAPCSKVSFWLSALLLSRLCQLNAVLWRNSLFTSGISIHSLRTRVRIVRNVRKKCLVEYPWRTPTFPEARPSRSINAFAFR